MLFFLAALAVTDAPQALNIATSTFQAQFQRGSMVALETKDGVELPLTPEEAPGAGLRMLSGDHWATSAEASAEPANGTFADGKPVEETAAFGDFAGGKVRTMYAPDTASGDLVITQEASAPEKGLWGVDWSISGIPLDRNIIIPGTSGMRLTRETPGIPDYFEYPMSWEAQLVIVEHGDRGFYVWAEDAKGVFKRLEVRRTAQGWYLRFVTMPFAPFENCDRCGSVKWHLNVHQGDWREPARRYRAWAANAWGLTANAIRPAWARDMRACAIMPQDMAALEAMPGRLDPRQTLLYLYDWRQAGYDRNYPEYDKPVETLEPFVRRAHELGFRVMLHVNYFGCDPLNPLYAQFEPFQVRNPWGKHDKEWWEWLPAKPPIKFAYINPAHGPWRALFVSRMAELVTATGVDALHLDQTLCIYNDYNGLIDGLSMIEGNLALHKELREALPDIAISGEGLNEVTCRYEAFAQRHAWGLNHSDGTYNLPQLRAAHPISSFLLRPYTIMYGYLGYAPPTDAAMYNAWNEAYANWSIIPTLKPSVAELKDPSGFSQQFFDEAAFWQGRRVEPDMDTAWPGDVAFPFRTSDGERAIRTRDRRLVCGDDGISRTITGVSSIALPGTIAGWRVYDAQGLRNLDPGAWYAYFPQPRDMTAFHLASVPAGFTCSAVVENDDFALARIDRAGGPHLLLAELIHEATCGSRPFEGKATETRGDLYGADGAMFTGVSNAATGGTIQAHPPYKAPGTGIVFARFTLDLPSGTTEFSSEVAMEAAAVGEGKSDGVTFGASVECEGRKVDASVHNATAEHRRLALDLRPFAGRKAALELTVDPGPARNPSFDWARWYGPRIECAGRVKGTVVLSECRQWNHVIAGTATTSMDPGKKELAIEADLPGSLYFFRNLPAGLCPTDLTAAPFKTAFLGKGGAVLRNAPNAAIESSTNSVGGVERKGFYAHPPDHGQALIIIPINLPGGPVRFSAQAGLREGSKSEGAAFAVEMNGVELVRREMMPGRWETIECDLSAFSGRAGVLTLITDSLGTFYYDWCCWGDPQVVKP